MDNPTSLGESHTTERVAAPATGPNWVMPRQKQIERHGDATSAYSVRYPQVRGGICEYCGVIDPQQPSQFQYKLCTHYRGMQMRCTYCPPTKEADDVIYHAVLNVAEHPDNPEKLVIWCDSYDCSKKHIDRFKVSA